jgi:hypothetical protein
MEYEFINQIKNLHKVHCVTKDFNHIIEYETGSWKMFEPSKFIYSYFAFNTFYNFDWENSIKNKRLVPYDIDSYLSESNRFYSMIEFIFCYWAEDFDADFFRILLHPFRLQWQNPENHLVNALKKINSDVRITFSVVDSFKEEIERLLTSKKVLKTKLKNVVLRFIYQVRNNIFHGTKSAIEMMDRDQRLRLELYSRILIATNEMLFKVLEKELQLNLDKKYRILY